MRAVLTAARVNGAEVKISRRRVMPSPCVLRDSIYDVSRCLWTFQRHLLATQSRTTWICCADSAWEFGIWVPPSLARAISGVECRPAASEGGCAVAGEGEG